MSSLGFAIKCAPAFMRKLYRKSANVILPYTKTPKTLKQDSLDESELNFSIDRFSVLDNVIYISGWLLIPSCDIIDMALEFPSGRFYPISKYGLSSPDVQAVHGAHAGHVRFSDQLLINESHENIMKARLVVRTKNNCNYIIENLAQPAEPTQWLQDEFLACLGKKETGRLLEIGSRARSGVVRRNLAPQGWSYTGLDVMSGSNVDVVGDAHKLSKLFPQERFDGVMGFSVLEHLMMPWKFSVELNKVLNVGGIGFLVTHQCWPIHDAPWDFWRFSDSSWASLFNRITGFEIIRTAAGGTCLYRREAVSSGDAFRGGCRRLSVFGCIVP
jgi:2-polyprenyl-3-methyl-5-hydroxy-6-metoxy-1,4-benzoquinol methylase